MSGEEKDPLYQIFAEHLESFLQQARTSEHRLPLHVEKEMRAYLECGVLAYEFVRVRCEECGKSRAKAFFVSWISPPDLRAKALPCPDRSPATLILVHSTPTCIVRPVTHRFSSVPSYH